MSLVFALVLWSYQLSATAQLPEECDTPEEQYGPECQALCGCDCTAATRTSCQRVCGLPQGVQSIPWCTNECIEDDDVGFLDYMKRTSQWNEDITTCVDAPSCSEEIASFCCEQCKNGDVTLEIPWADDADPVHVYMSVGQSNCAGSASADLMKQDGVHLKLFEKNTTKSRAWFAGLTSRDGGGDKEDSFGMTALWAGCVGSRHGPEIAYGYRLQELTGKRVLIFKYCLGGTSAKEDWNPDWTGNSLSDGNYWDKSKDNKTAAFLKNLRMGNPKQQQYLRYTYNLRLMREQLDDAGVKYEFKAIFWRQSSADKDSDWKQYGADQIRVFNAMRAEVAVPDLPIIFEGDARPNIHGGKVYAAKVLCNATVGMSMTGGLIPNSPCTPTVANSCIEYTSFSGEMENQFGWDTNFPLEYKVPKPGFSAATSRWVVRFQTVGQKKPNLHDEYDGMWWNGNAMANAYVREHTNYAVPLAMTEWDKWAKWPAKRCTIQNPWSEANYCWEDASAGCDRAQEAQEAPTGMCGSVTAESCRTTEAHYTKCPCACQDAATCTAEPPVIDSGTLTYFPDMPTSTTSTMSTTSTTSTTSETSTTGIVTTKTRAVDTAAIYANASFANNLSVFYLLALVHIYWCAR